MVPLFRFILKYKLREFNVYVVSILHGKEQPNKKVKSRIVRIPPPQREREGRGGEKYSYLEGVLNFFEE